METALLADFERFVSFSSTQKKFCLFLPLPFREKSERPEKAHSSLYSLSVNLGNSRMKEVKRRGCFRCCVAFNQTQHKQRSSTFIHIFLLMGA